MKDVKALVLLTSLLVATLAYGQSAKSSAVGDNTWLGPGLVTAEKTISPNGRYAIVVDKDGSSESQLADVIEHRLLGKIPGTDYWAYGNRHLNAWWAADSSWCAAVHYNRLGFDECVVIEPHGDSFGATEIGKQIHDALEAGIQKQSHDPGPDRGEGLCVRPRQDRTLLVRAFGTTNPKGMEGGKTYESFLSGSYDVATNKWAKLNVRPLDPKVNIGASLEWPDEELVRVIPRNAPWPADFNGEVVRSEEERAKVLDRLLNETYAAVRFVEPPARFARIKEEQKAWLARWQQQKSQQEKNAMTDARVHQLRAILWEE
jgi:hypothetical protein